MGHICFINSPLYMTSDHKTHLYIKIAIVASDKNDELGDVGIIDGWQLRRGVYRGAAVERTGQH